jgi:ubiquinone/menaquinone biosynthesis C-methylase UbiE
MSEEYYKDDAMDLEFTGEYYVPGKSPMTVEEDHLERYKFAVQFVRDKVVLDIACGTGYGSSLLKCSGAISVDGVDISEPVIAYARQHYAKDGLSFTRGDVTEYSSDKSYDVIVCFETIEHIRDYDTAIERLYALLKKGGKLIISSPNRSITSPKAKKISDRPSIRHHMQEFTIDELLTLLEKHRFLTQKDAVYGQRQQRYFRNKIMRRFYKNMFKPDLRCSPVVSKVDALTPRYFLVVASKE